MTGRKAFTYKTIAHLKSTLKEDPTTALVSLDLVALWPTTSPHVMLLLVQQGAKCFD
jgi:hypothetical protein